MTPITLHCTVGARHSVRLLVFNRTFNATQFARVGSELAHRHMVSEILGEYNALTQPAHHLKNANFKGEIHVFSVFLFLVCFFTPLLGHSSLTCLAMYSYTWNLTCMFLEFKPPIQYEGHKLTMRIVINLRMSLHTPNHITRLSLGIHSSCVCPSRNL